MSLLPGRLSSLILLIPILCLLSACGGGTTVNGLAESDNDSGDILLNSIAVQPVPENTVTPFSVVPAADAAVQNSTVPANEPESDEQAANDPVVNGSVPDVVAVETASAVVADEATPPVIANNTVDQVNTTQTAVVEDKEYSVADITDLILVTGQSNALGADTTYDPHFDSPHERVFAFTGSGWQRADLHQVWDLDWLPRGHQGNDPSNNFALHAAKEIAHKRPDRVIGFVLVTAPGKGIEHWDSDGSFFSELNQKALAAINHVPHKSGFDGILWHQGENNEGEYDYHLKLDQLISNFRQQSWFESNRPFICGETAEFDIVNAQLMALDNNGDQWSACVDSNGLQTREDGYHFSAEGLRELGRRYGVKYSSMIN